MPSQRFCWRRACLFGGLLIMALPALHGGDVNTLATIAEREVARRQALISAADAKLDEAAALDAKGSHAEAAKLLLDAYHTLPDSPSADAVKARLRTAFAESACDEAEALLAQARYREANAMLDSVLAADVDPDNAEAKKLKRHAADPDRYPPALTPQHIADKANVEKWLVLANSALDLGDYDRALSVFADVLRVDRYNVAARRGMELVEQHKARYYDAARDHARSRALGEVQKGWEPDVPPSADMTAMFASSAGGGSANRGAREALEKKLHTLRVPKVEFTGASLEEVVEYLRVSSRNIDPEGVGVSFVLNVEPELRARTMTMSLVDMPLDELIRYIVELAGASYKVDGTAVSILSLTSHSVELITKQYRVPPDFIQSAEVGGATAVVDPFAKASTAVGGPQGLQVRRLGAKEFLESRGVTFPDGAGATFVPSTSTLMVRNNAENLAIVDMLVEQALGGTLKQVKVSVRLVQVSQETFNEIGADLGLGASNLPGSNRVFVSGGTPASSAAGSGAPLVTSGLRSSGVILGKPSIDQLIHQNGDTPSITSVSPSQFQLIGAFTDPQFQARLRALQQSKGFDVVTAPEVVTKSGQKASIRIVREFPYPTEFDPPQIPQQGAAPITAGGLRVANPNSSGPVTPATPTAFEKKELGVILEVEPNVSGDGRTVDVAVSPSLTDFEGFIDYGDDIKNRIDFTIYDPIIPTTPLIYTRAGTQYTQQNDILQPVFRKTSANSTVTIYDGATIVLGGLIDERVTDLNDKVPMIGDIPLIGRMWQSKIKQSQKRCVLFFVTVTVIDPSGQRINAPTTAAAQAGQ